MAQDVMAPWQASAPDLQECLICASLLHGALLGLRVPATSLRGAQPWPTLCVPTSLYSPRASLPGELISPDPSFVA